MLRILVFLFFPLFFILNVKAEETKYPYADSSSLEINVIQKEDLQVYLDDEDFNYLTTPVLSKNNNFWLRLYNWLKKNWRNFGGLVEAIPWVLRLIFWGAVIFLVIIIFTKTKLNRIFYSERDVNLPEYNVLDPDEIVEDFDQAIQNEINNGNFRKAVRLHFLKCINFLDDKDFINYSKEKTNTDYLRELKNVDVREKFNRLSNIYNNVWYGLFGINEEEYHGYEKSFNELYLSINVQK